jgi:hypothetical protein
MWQGSCSQSTTQDTLTKTRRKNILLLGILANGQLVVQTELAIAIVAAQCAVFLRALGDCIGRIGFGVRIGLFFSILLCL